MEDLFVSSHCFNKPLATPRNFINEHVKYNAQDYLSEIARAIAAASPPKVIRVRRVAVGAKTETAWATAVVTWERRQDQGRGPLGPCGDLHEPTSRTDRPANPSASTHRSISPADSNKWRPGDGTSSSRGHRCHGSPPGLVDSDYSGVSRRASATLE